MRAAAVLLVLPALLAGCLAGEPAERVAGGQIDGAVVDHLLHPYANQTVHLVQLERTDATSPLGGFTFRNVPPGVYTVTTSVPGASSTQLVDVEAGKITRVILQLAVPDADTSHLEAFDLTSERAQMAQPGAECTVCRWEVPIEAGERPAEVTFEAAWPTLPLADDDKLDITISADGFPLFSGLVASPTNLTLDGGDVPEGARTLVVTARFGPGFTPQPAFTADAVMRLYYGATRDEYFGVA